MNSKLKILGMSCAACSSFIERSVSQMDGVTSIRVDLINAYALIEYNVELVSVDKIIDKINSIGYRASFGQKEEKDKSLIRLIISLCFLLALMFFSMSHMLGIHLHIKNYVLGLIEFGLLIPIIILNFHYFKSGYYHLFKGPNMDTLVALSATASTIFGLYVITRMMIDNTYSAHLFFESAGMILSFVSIGKYLENKAKKKTTDSLKAILEYAPKTSSVLKDGVIIEKMSQELEKGDIVIVKLGDKIPVDGIVVKGSALVNESTITGESIFVQKEVGSKVLKGTINTSGYLEFESIANYGESVFDQIVKKVEEVTMSKAKVERLADKIAFFFVPTVLLISIITLSIWLIISHKFDTSLNYALSVLVISCPCALGLSTPVAITAASGKAALNHILYKNAESIENLSKVETVILDKTGTITKGEPKVVKAFGNINLDLVYLAESKSNHPYAKSICEYIGSSSKTFDFMFEEISGMGIKIKSSKEIYLGNIKLLNELGVEPIEIDSELSAIYYVEDNKCTGAFLFDDEIRKTSEEAINEFKKLGLSICMATGDKEVVAKELAKKLGIDYYAEILPEEKLKVVEKYEDTKTVFCGDGVNDSIALKKAFVGVSLGGATQIAKDEADVILVRNDLYDLVNAIKLSRFTMKIIKENLFWAFFYNLLLIPIAAGVLSKIISLNPMIASIAMSISSITVVLNALRINRFKFKKGENNMKELVIERMMCSHCEARVKGELEKVGQNVYVSQKEGIAKLDTNLSNQDLINLIDNLGYKVKEIK